MSMYQHLQAYKWTEQLSEQTVTIVKNPFFGHAKEIIQVVHDFDHVPFQNVDEGPKKFDDLFNKHEGVFWIACEEVAPSTFVLLENNGYFANERDNVERLSQNDTEKGDSVCATIFWNVNAHYNVMIGVNGKCIFAGDPFGMSGSDMLKYNEGDEEAFKQLWTWGDDVFQDDKFDNSNRILPGMFWLASLVTGYSMTRDFWERQFNHVGCIGLQEQESLKKANKADGPSVQSPLFQRQRE